MATKATKAKATKAKAAKATTPKVRKPGAATAATEPTAEKRIIRDASGKARERAKSPDSVTVKELPGLRITKHATKQGERHELNGLPVTTVIRAAGRAGMRPAGIIAAFAALEVPVAEATVRTQYNWRMKKNEAETTAGSAAVKALLAAAPAVETPAVEAPAKKAAPVKKAVAQ